MLTPEQFQQVERYIDGKGVPYYDVRVEFADHLSEQVQAAMQERGIGFVEALGEQGPIFSQDWPLIVKYKTMYVRKKILKTYRDEIIRYFTWPKIGITLSVIGAMLVLNATSYIRINNNVTDNIILVLVSVNLFYLRRDWRNIVQKNLYEPNMHRRLLIGKQFSLANTYFGAIQLLYFLLVIANVIWWSPGYAGRYLPPTLLNKILFYSLPLVLILKLAWRKTSVDLNKAMRNNYPSILTGKSLKEIIAGLRQEYEAGRK